MTRAPETPTPGDRIPERSEGRAAQVSQPIRAALSPPPPPGGVEELVELVAVLREARIFDYEASQQAAYRLMNQAADALLSQARVLRVMLEERDEAERLLEERTRERDQHSSDLDLMAQHANALSDHRRATEARAETAERLLEEVEGALGKIARGEVPPEKEGHYLAHRAAVKIARQALSSLRKEKGSARDHAQTTGVEE